MLKLNYYYFLCTILFVFNYFIYFVQSLNYYDIKIHTDSKYIGLNCGQNNYPQCKTLSDAYDSLLQKNIIISPSDNIGVRFYFAPGIYKQTDNMMTFDGFRTIQFIGSDETSKTIIEGLSIPMIDLTEKVLLTGDKSVEFQSITLQDFRNYNLIWYGSNSQIPLSIIMNQVIYDKSGVIINQFHYMLFIKLLSFTKSKIINSNSGIYLLNTTLYMDQVEISNCFTGSTKGFIQLESGSLNLKNVTVIGNSMGTLISIKKASSPNYPAITSFEINNLNISNNSFYYSSDSEMILNINDVQSNGYINNTHFKYNTFYSNHFFSPSMISISQSNIEIINGLTVFGNDGDTMWYNNIYLFVLNLNNSLIGMLSYSSFDTVNVIMGSNSSIKIRNNNFKKSTEFIQCINCKINEESNPSSKLNKNLIIVIVVVPVLSLILLSVVILFVLKKRKKNKLSNMVSLSTINGINKQTDNSYITNSINQKNENSIPCENNVTSINE